MLFSHDQLNLLFTQMFGVHVCFSTTFLSRYILRYFTIVPSDIMIHNIFFSCGKCKSVNKKGLYDVETRCSYSSAVLQYTMRNEDRIDEMMGVEYNTKIVPYTGTVLGSCIRVVWTTPPFLHLSTFVILCPASQFCILQICKLHYNLKSSYPSRNMFEK